MKVRLLKDMKMELVDSVKYEVFSLYLINNLHICTHIYIS